MMIERLWVMGIQASLLIVVVLILRLLLKRCSKVYSYCLWMLVLLRLLCPVFIESRMSLQPDLVSMDAVFPAEGNIPKFVPSFGKEEEILPEAPLPAQENNNGHINSQAGKDTAVGTDRENKEKTMQDPLSAFTRWIFKAWTLQGGLRLMWAAGAVLLLFWFVYQYIRIRKKVSMAVLEEDNIFRCENIKSPFVMGIFRPRIYLPYKMWEVEKDYILAHERVHIRHKDPLIRVAGIMALCLHWWNPLVWYGVHKMAQDMEMFCDETVLAKATGRERKAYSRALLHAAMRQSGFSVVIPFGESKTEQRIRNILRKKHRGMLLTFFALLLFVGCAVAFLTSPSSVKAMGEEEAIGVLEAMEQNLLACQEEIEKLQKWAEDEAEKKLLELPAESIQDLSNSTSHREGFKMPQLTYEETPYSIEEKDISYKEKLLAVRALRDLYDLTGTQVNACFYTYTSPANYFSFGMEKGDITHNRIFYSRSFGESEGYLENSISSMDITNGRRVWFSPVQQYDIPANMEEMDYGEQAVWFLEHSAVFQGGNIVSTGLVYELEPEWIRVFLEDGSFYEVGLDTYIQAVNSIYGPYPEGFEH